MRQNIIINKYIIINTVNKRMTDVIKYYKLTPYYK